MANSIRNIIFDLGGVILNIDPQLTVEAFRDLGWKDFFDEKNQTLNKDLFYNLEMGQSSPEAFRENVRVNTLRYVSDIEIDTAWSAMLLDIPAERVRYLESLRKDYRLYLLSNTNEIHRMVFHQKFEDNYGYSLFGLFERNFYSHEMGLRKPNPLIFVKALEDAGLVPEETLFIDDMKDNTDAAQTTGMRVLHIEPGTLLERLPEYLDRMGRGA
jgi:glucose-1-phosphatase